MRLEYPGLIPVDSGTGCEGCELAKHPKECITTACSPDEWPGWHHLSNADNIIWVRPQ